MDTIIQKAIEGGWRPKALNCEGKSLSWIKQAIISRSKYVERYVLDPLFWQALSINCGWYNGVAKMEKPKWVVIALYFHEINLTKGLDAAIAYLKELTK